MIQPLSQCEELYIPGGDIEQYRLCIDRPTPTSLYCLPYRDGHVLVKIFKDRTHIAWERRLKQIFRRFALLPYKSYVKDGAQKKQIEERYLSLWRQHNYPAPALFSLLIPGCPSETTVVMAYVEGVPLFDVLNDSKRTMKEKFTIVRSILHHMAERHDIAMTQNKPKLVHPDANAGNILVDGDAFIFIDYARTAQLRGPVSVLAAHELTKFIKGVVEGLGRDRLDDVIGLVWEAYRSSIVPMSLIKASSSGLGGRYHGWRARLRRRKGATKLDRFLIAGKLRASQDRTT